MVRTGSTDLPTSAEQKADGARSLTEFKNFSLPGVREEVTSMLSLIGRTEGIFSTYTIHDISHIDTMLKMLDWLIPTRTAKAMTPADWLQIVLAVYLHDLGMAVTAEEFQQRDQNPEFRRWFDNLEKTNDGREYLARTHRMNEEEKQRFFFQEFVRKGHAARIREWITNRHSRTWGPRVTPIACCINELLRPLPVRFRDYLGTVCESHHADNLDRIDVYPLCAPCGNEPGELINVQYAAILLRTVDLLHVTKDRTPSVMYETIKLSDPKGVDEWDKQLGTFAVRPQGRVLVEGESETAVITVNADFSEERPLFALQEYIAYANRQIEQSKRWADKSEQSRDARDYSFPWHTVKGDVRLEGVPPQPLRFQLDRGRLLDLLVGHTIYNDPTVAIRELLQNAIDAVRYQHHLAVREARASGREPPVMGGVVVRWNPGDRLLVVEDNGVGMDQDVIQYHLMQVGASFYNTPQFESEHRDFSPISRFGIGVLTCFMVSDDIEIVTCQGDRGHRIRMTSVHADYLLRELQLGDPKLEGLEPHGTRVTLRLRETIDLSKKSIRDIVQYWVILPECAVEYTEAGKELESIGFASPVEALQYYHDLSNKAGSSVGNLDSQVEILCKSRSTASDHEEIMGTGRYELAFAVREGFFPEKAFARQPDRPRGDFPAICIEGIRVSARLPGFGGSYNSLLSVRGDRSFRTTVSRSGLEQDEEFHRVGKLCADMLFEHVSDEVTRIANKTGKPLSQASTASRWLFNDLIRDCSYAEYLALIIASATLELALRASRRRRQIDRSQNRRKQGTRFLAKKSLCRCRAVRTQQKKVVNRGQAGPFTRQVKPSKLMVTQGEIAVSRP